MKQIRFKKVPFDIELAKKIAKGEMKGRIVTHEGREVRIVCWDKKPIEEYPIVVLAKNDHVGEMLYTCTEEGFVINSPNYKSPYDLILEIPTYYEDYSSFVIQKGQSCLVRNFSSETWVVRTYAGRDSDNTPIFISPCGRFHCYWKYILPISNDTECLIGTTKSYEQLCEELDQKIGKEL